MTENIIGQRIKAIRYITVSAYENLGWDEAWMPSGLSIHLDNGVVLYAAGGEDGEVPGWLYGSKGRERFRVEVGK